MSGLPCRMAAGSYICRRERDAGDCEGNLDHDHRHPFRQRPAAAPPGEGAPARYADAAQARLDPGQGARLAGLSRDDGDRPRARPRHGLRGGRLPEHRRVLVEEARHLHDHGRHLHARLRLLQCADRHCRGRSIRPSRSGSPTRRAKLGLAHVVITSVDRDDLADGGAAHFAETIAAIRAAERGDHRGADARLPAQGRRGRDGRRRASPTSSTTTSRPCRRNT